MRLQLLGAVRRGQIFFGQLVPRPGAGARPGLRHGGSVSGHADSPDPGFPHAGGRSRFPCDSSSRLLYLPGKWYITLAAPDGSLRDSGCEELPPSPPYRKEEAKWHVKLFLTLTGCAVATYLTFVCLLLALSGRFRLLRMVDAPDELRRACGSGGTHRSQHLRPRRDTRAQSVDQLRPSRRSSDGCSFTVTKITSRYFGGNGDGFSFFFDHVIFSREMFQSMVELHFSQFNHFYIYKCKIN